MSTSTGRAVLSALREWLAGLLPALLAVVAAPAIAESRPGGEAHRSWQLDVSAGGSLLRMAYFPDSLGGREQQAATPGGMVAAAGGLRLLGRGRPLELWLRAELAVDWHSFRPLVTPSTPHPSGSLVLPGGGLTARLVWSPGWRVCPYFEVGLRLAQAQFIDSEGGTNPFLAGFIGGEEGVEWRRSPSSVRLFLGLRVEAGGGQGNNDFYRAGPWRASINLGVGL